MNSNLYVCYSVDWMKLNEIKFIEQILRSVGPVCTHAPEITEV